jgi:hypothetical protein
MAKSKNQIPTVRKQKKKKTVWERLSLFLVAMDRRENLL